MRKIVVGTMVSLDGVMQAPGGPDEDKTSDFKFGGWVFPYFDDVVNLTLGEVFSEPFDLLLGRRTYDIFAAHWPRVAADPVAAGVGPEEAELAKTFDKITKYVATHSPQTLNWKNSEALGTDIVGRLKELKKGNGPTLLVQGSSDLIQTLLSHDLVDELNLIIFPLTLGRGKRIFGEGAMPAAFKLKKSATSPSGAIAVTYVRDGKVQVGSFALPPES